MLFQSHQQMRHMLTSGALCALSILVLAGCAATYAPPPLTTQHPAHPEATAAPSQPQSTTLAYTPSDSPSAQPVRPMAQQPTQPGMQHGMHGAGQSDQASQSTVVGEGKVIAVVPSSGQIVLDHKEIKGFMEAMTMGYRIEPPALMQGLQSGDSVRFTIDTENRAIIKIEKLPE